MNKFSQLETSELKKQLETLKEDLDDLQMEKNMVLGQRGLHVSSKKIAQQAREFEDEINKLLERITQLEEEIQRRDS